MKPSEKTTAAVAKGVTRPPLERMLCIHRRLKRGLYPNCQQLGSELEVSYKTISRDIQFMKYRLNLPIEFDRQRNGYYYTEPVRSFPTMEVTEGELLALLVAGKALVQYEGTPFERPLRSAFKKLTEGLSDSVAVSWDDLDRAISFRAIGVTVADLELFQTLSHAVLKSLELEFDYRKLRITHYERRRVEPYHLACIENQWYLFGFDLRRHQMRTFVLSRMRNVRPTGRRFPRPIGFSLAKHLRGSFGVFKGTKPQEIRIRFDSWAAQLIRERHWHPSQKIQELRNGEIELSLRLTSFAEIMRWILSWGEHARAVAPPALVAEIQRTLKAMIILYR